VHRSARSYRRTASRPASDGFVFGMSRPPRLTEVSERREHSGRDDPVESLSRPTSERRSRRLTPVVVIRLPSPRVPTRILALVRASPPDRPCPRGFWPRKTGRPCASRDPSRRRRRRPLRHRITQSRYRSPSARGLSKGCDPDVCHRIVLATRSASTSCSLHERASKTTSPIG